MHACMHACMHECIPTEDISLYRPVKTRDVCRYVSCMHMCVCVCARLPLWLWVRSDEFDEHQVLECRLLGLTNQWLFSESHASQGTPEA